MGIANQIVHSRRVHHQGFGRLTLGRCVLVLCPVFGRAVFGRCVLALRLMFGRAEELQILYSVFHLLGFINGRNQLQESHPVANTVFVLLTKDNTNMLGTGNG